MQTMVFKPMRVLKYCLQKELTEVTGQYTIKSSKWRREAAESWFESFCFQRDGALESKIECGDDGKITAYFKLAEEADYYYIFLQKDSYDFSKYGFKNTGVKLT